MLIRMKPDSVSGQVAQSLACKSQLSKAELSAWLSSRNRAVRSRRATTRSREVLKHLFDGFGGHGRRTWRSLQQQGAVWPLHQPRPARELLHWAETRSEEADQFLLLLRRQRLRSGFNLE